MEECLRTEADNVGFLNFSPACILSFVITAVVRGELSEIWRWSDGPGVKENSAEGKKKTM